MPKRALLTLSRKVFAIVLVSVSFKTQHVCAADFKGATEVLRMASEALPKKEVRKNDPYAAFREKLKQFPVVTSNQPPEQVVKEWLDLIDQFDTEAAKRNSANRSNPGLTPLEFTEVMDVLPPPTMWSALEKQIDSRTATNKADTRRNVGLRLIAHTLTRNTAKRAEDMKAVGRLAKDSASAYEFVYTLESLNQAILATMDNPDAVLHMLETQLAGPTDYPMELQVPNLVPLVGAEKAEAFLRNAMVGSRKIAMDPITATHKLALKVGTEMVDSMKIPQWGLVDSLDAVEFYEALDKKFNSSTNTGANPEQSEFLAVTRNSNPYDGQNARIYYFLGLIAANRTADAINVAKRFDRNTSTYFSSDIIKQMERAGLTQQLNNLFAALLKDNPECPFWSEYVRVAAHAGHANEALQLVRTTLDRSGLSSRRRRELTNLLPTALLANDEIDEAVTELRHSFTNSSQAATGDDEETQPALRLARIGKLLNRTNWLEEGLAIARKNLTNETGPDSRPNLDTELAQILTEIGRGAEAEEVLAITLRQAIQASQQTQNRFDGMNRSQAASMLVELVKLYHHAGRYEDVLRVLDDSPNWGAPDLLQLDSLSSYSYYRVRGHYIAELPVSYYAAAALAKVGRKAEATKILDHLFEQHAGSDRLYELLLEMDSTNPMAKLESLYAKDRFEERPLIWEAHWLRLQGKLEEAETLARKAISIDPSDGEEGPGDRMRAYAELAEIRAARNDQKEADFFRGVVSAIRESEQADQFQAAGLLKRAVKMYEDALNHFADAYCIQSRLAIQLADLGMHQQAEEHYRRAYELMPDSFGRVESHCFGCERAFEGEKAQNIAEKVFTEIAQKTPQKPQVHYLLGYLRDEQERPKDAAASYRQAVKLDPDYLNAWIKLSQEGSKVFLPESERDEIVFNLIRLDPHQKHGGFDVSHVSDLAGLWNHVAGDPLLREQSKVQSLYPLPASKRKLEEHGNDAARQQAELWQQRMADRENEANTPAQLISQNAFIRAGISLVARTDSGSD